MNFIFGAEINNRQIILENPSEFWKFARKFEGKKIQLLLRKYTTSRSLKQNAYYFGVVVPIIADWAGEDDKESIHQALKEKFLKVRDSKGLKIIQSTTKLNTTEFEIYLGKVKRWASVDCGLIIPEPSRVLEVK